MMDITVLGCAASTPTPERSLPSIAVRIEGEVLLLDCGEGSQRQMMRHGVSYAQVKAVFLSHLHLDHFLGLFGLGETLRLSGRPEPIEVFGPPGTSRFLSSFGPREIFSVHEITKELLEKCAPAAKAPAAGPLYSLNEHDVFVIPASHGARVNAYSFIIRERDRRRFHEKKAKDLGLAGPMFKEIQKKGSLKVGKKTIKLEDVTYVQPGKMIAYSGDTAYSPSLVHAARGADLLIHDSTFDETQRALADEKAHSTAADAAKTAAAAKVKQLLLFHLSGRYRDPKPLVEEAKKIFPNTIAAEDGLKITL